MKNKLVILSIAAAVGIAISALGAELQKGIDLTGLSSVSASQLNQLVDNARPATNRGLVYVGATAPTITGTNAYRTNYIWVDISALPFTLRTYQTGSWNAATIGANSVNTGNIVDGAVTNPKLAANAVNSTNISDNAVIEAKIAAGSVTTTKIGTGAVTTDNILDGTIATIDIGDGQVTAPKLASGAVTAAALGSQSVYGTNLVNGTITSTQIAGGTINGTNIAGGTISGTNIAGATISKTNLAFGTYTNSSGSFAIPAAGASGTFAHTLGVVPTIVRVVLVCDTADLNYTAGDEVNITAFQNVVGADDYPAFAVTADATNVYVTRGSGASTITGINRTTGAAAGITTGNWTVKVYAVYLP